MDKIKLQNVKTLVVKEVEKSVANDYLSTKEWKIFETKKVVQNETKEEIEVKEVKKSKSSKKR